MSDDLHETARKILEYVREHPHPSYAEIGAAVGLVNLTRVKVHADRLVTAGLLRDRRVSSGQRVPRSLEAA